ncbi:lytic transglycosylase domain-containing protein [Kordiimonas sp.]|uniref:lytic transglycosylase domain-containing protein n=1 Tax=Kordiimonas sp. TaxID=1970157 RepID=UPI003A9224D3
MSVRIVLISICFLLLAASPASRAVPVEIPTVLSSEDINRYRRIFELQEQAKWNQADKMIARLENPVLMGHVWFQRYMHPTGYRSKYSELAGWLKAYADHPNAWRVYSLARRRQGNAHAPRRPSETRYPGVTGQAADPKPPLPSRTRDERSSVTTFMANVRRSVRKGEPERAEKRYWAMVERDLLVPYEEAEALERIAASYYYKSNDFKARVLSTRAAELAREIVPEVDWIAGLSNWRTGDYATAYKHFTYLANSERAGSWLLSAGQFWAGRTAYRVGDVSRGAEHLRAASTYVETFYGLIAARQLGIKPEIDWSVPELRPSALKRLLDHPATHRAIALTEIGRDDIADEELRLLWGREGTTVQEDLLALGARLNLPNIQIRLGRVGGTGKPASTAVRYPLPDWAPAGGFSVDRALIFAMVRKESDFRIRAKSRVGAGGLMQVMPATASYISKNRKLLKRNRNRLFEPEFNMALGQQYIEYLLDMDYVEGNLFMALAAYNGGPGSLMGWHKEVIYGEDPLLFIESIGFYETRNYIERVMANLWLYRMRLGQETPSLDAIASGAWPTLELLDTEDTALAHQRALTRIYTGATDSADD